LAGVGYFYPTLPDDAVASLWGKIRKGEAPGRRSIMQAVPDGTLLHLSNRISRRCFMKRFAAGALTRPLMARDRFRLRNRNLAVDNKD
jgi:hypothetical protein